MITATFYRCDTQAHALALLHRWRGGTAFLSDLSKEFPELGDIVLGNRSQAWLGLVRGTLFVRLGIDAGDADFEILQERREELLRSIIDILRTKLQGEAGSPLSPMDLTVQVSSDSAREGSNEPILVTSILENGGSHPRMAYRLYRVGEGLQESVELTAVEKAPFGFELDVSSLTPGEYELSAKVFDDLNRIEVTSVRITILGGDTDSTLTLPTTKDSTLRANKPHRNEGANPASSSATAFKPEENPTTQSSASVLQTAISTGLTKATLIMNVQDCDLPRRWGRNGRYIEAHPVNEPWVEGNGNKFRVQGHNGKTKGKGQGVTWFSPVDNKIQNNRPNGASHWSGARQATGPATAPAILLTNRQTGPVEFDVTQDVLTGFQDGWILKKQDETQIRKHPLLLQRRGSRSWRP